MIRNALLNDAEHLNNKPFFALVVFGEAAAGTTAAAAATTVCAQHFIAHLKIE